MDSDRWYSASHMGGLDELLEDCLELGELYEQLELLNSTSLRVTRRVRSRFEGSSEYGDSASHRVDSTSRCIGGCPVVEIVSMIGAVRVIGSVGSFEGYLTRLSGLQLWFHVFQFSVITNNLFTSWPDFSRALELRFGPSSFENHQAALFKLQQTTTVTEYVANLERLSNMVVGLQPDALLNCFVSGLRPTIQNELAILKPTSFTQAVGLAKLLEEKLTVATSSAALNHTVSLPPPALLPTPTIRSSVLVPASATITSVVPAASAPLPTARLSSNQLQQRRAAGLCFRCPEHYTPGHRCNPPQFLLIMDNTPDLTTNSTLPMLTENPDVPHFLSISPAVFFGMTTATSMKLTGLIKDRPISIMVDSDSTHNLIQPHVASLLNLTIQPTPPFPVLVGNSEPLHCHGYCPRVPVTLDGSLFPVPFFLFAFT
uniref:Retrotransposon gag domain-containing protein n=1 Tax=Lactuca sativa TaxID=4236 RepID=A0A9R1XQX2_LACSA|nr:hypothetical protein LSAT_V11C300118660 [Lactuca sativa]